MNRIDQKFRDLKRNKKKAFIAFITAGDPNLKTTEELVYAFESSGVDIIELGVPFSDPLADGSTIQASSQRALKRGINLKKIFNTVISPRMKEDLYAIHDFKDKYNLKIKVLRKEFIVLLKAVTERDKDFEDILTIIKKEKNFDWQYLINEVLWQYKHGDSWILLDTEKMIKELKKYTFVEQKYLKQLYDAYGKKN